MQLIRARGGGARADRLLWPAIALLPLLAVLLAASLLIDRGGLSGDEGPLVAEAHRILQGHYAVIGTMAPVQFLWHGPGLPLVLAPLVALRVPPAELRLISPILMFAAALLFYRFLRLRLTPRAALAGAYALGLYAPAYYVLGAAAKDPLALLLSILVLDGTSRYLNHGRRRHGLVAGLSLGALAMTRLEYGWLVVVLLGVSVGWWVLAHIRGGLGSEPRRLARRSALICGVGLLACTPWLLYTYRLTRQVFYWGNSGGVSLYWMSAPGHGRLGEWHSLHAVFTDPLLARYRPFFHHLATLTPVRADLALQHAAVTNAVSHPGHYVINLVANVSRMLAGFPFSFTLPFGLIVGTVLINGALLAGLVAVVRSMVHNRGSMPVEGVPFLLFGAVGFAIHLFPTSEPRMVVPLIPVPIWLICQRLPHWLTACGRWKASVLPARVQGSLVGALSALPGIRPPAGRRIPSPSGTSLRVEADTGDHISPSKRPSPPAVSGLVARRRSVLAWLVVAARSVRGLLARVQAARAQGR